MKSKVAFEHCQLNQSGAIAENKGSEMTWTNDAREAYGKELVAVAANVCAECRAISICNPHITAQGVTTKI
ncbi:MAG: hypothetical protein VKL42_01715 [Snowella sp.]|nr:hypothetical protein [Snowella sp.]